MGMGDDDQPAANQPASQPDSLAGLLPVLRVRAAVEADLGAELWQLSDAQARDGVAESFAAAQQAHAAYLRRVADLDSRPGAVAGARPGAVAKSFLIHKLRRNPWDAGHDVRAAAVLNAEADPALGGLPRLGAALARGEISREHVSVGVKAMNRLPARLLREPVDAPTAAHLAGNPDGGDDATVLSHGDFVDDLLTRQSRQHPPGTVDRLARYLQHAADPDGATSFDPDAVTRREVSLFQEPDGMTIIRGQLDQANGALIRAAVDAFGRPDPARTETAEDGSIIEITDTRSGRQRAADALGIMARIALASGKAGSRGGEAPRIVIHTSLPALIAARHTPSQPSAGRAVPTEPDVPANRSVRGDLSGPGQLAVFGSGDPVDPAMLGRLACDAVLQRVLLAPSGAVLDLGRDARTATPAQRRALTARDRGCCIPGCTAPAAWCDAHHIHWWSAGGPTDLENLALVCGHHHTEIHQGIWTLEARDGIPWAIPPPWFDEQRRPIRNTWQDDLHAAHRLGTQLRLTLDPGGADPPCAA